MTTTVFVTTNHDTSMVNSPTQEIEDTTYNGWMNYETWNVALWIGNDEGLYNEARRLRHRGYTDLVELILDCGSKETPDGVKWDDVNLNTVELDEMMEEL